MPTFETTKGTMVFIPSRNVLVAESSPGGLSTVITFPMPTGAGQVEVKGTCQAVGDAIVAEERGPQGSRVFA